ncbi:unnamed protein product, partial [Iphiclides podalirius]
MEARGFGQLNGRTFSEARRNIARNYRLRPGSVLVSERDLSFREAITIIAFPTSRRRLAFASGKVRRELSTAPHRLAFPELWKERVAHPELAVNALPRKRAKVGLLTWSATPPVPIIVTAAAVPARDVVRVLRAAISRYGQCFGIGYRDSGKVPASVGPAWVSSRIAACSAPPLKLRQPEALSVS